MADATLVKYTPDSLIGDVSAKELHSVIAACSRGKALDSVREQIIARAEKLELGGLLPDNWRADGTLKSATATWESDEQRETWSDLYTGLDSALDDKYAALGDADGCHYYVYVLDFNDTEVIFRLRGDMYSAPYTVTEGGPITIGDAVKVRPVTEYVKTERTAGPLREWRKAKVANLKGLERRTFAASDMELRANEDGTLHFCGYACVTGVPYDMGWYQETIERGAFKRTLSESPDVQLLINHAGMPLARTSSGTLRLEERTTPDVNGKTGLWVDADLDAEDPDVVSLKRKMDRRDIDQMSFAFAPTAAGGWNEDYTERKIAACTIHRGDVSVVNQGANPATAGATLRSQNAIASLRHLGADGFVTALAEWRDHTLLPIEQRAGKALSAATMEVLSQVANLISGADDSLGEAQPMLAELMGVAVPVADDTDDEPAERAIEIPDHLTRARQELAMLTTRSRP